MSPTDEARMRAEVSSGLFSDRLQCFVANWAPQRDRAERDIFQMDLMRLLADAMRHQGNTLDFGVEMGFAAQWHQRASAPLQMIFKEKKDKPNGS